MPAGCVWLFECCWRLQSWILQAQFWEMSCIIARQPVACFSSRHMTHCSQPTWLLPTSVPCIASSLANTEQGQRVHRLSGMHACCQCPACKIMCLESWLLLPDACCITSSLCVRRTATWCAALLKWQDKPQAAREAEVRRVCQALGLLSFIGNATRRPPPTSLCSHFCFAYCSLPTMPPARAALTQLTHDSKPLPSTPELP